VFRTDGTVIPSEEKYLTGQLEKLPPEQRKRYKIKQLRWALQRRIKIYKRTVSTKARRSIGIHVKKIIWWQL
jgi:hypothetical protein